MHKITLEAAHIIAVLAYVKPKDKPFFPSHEDKTKPDGAVQLLADSLGDKTGTDKVEIICPSVEIKIKIFVIVKNIGEKMLEKYTELWYNELVN